MRIAFFVSVVVLAMPTSARAETAPEPFDACASIEAVVPATLPANVPGIPIEAPATLTTASLVAADGTAVATELIDDPLRKGYRSILAIRAELEVGATYTVRWTDECSGIRTRSFVTTARTAFPEAAGTARVGNLETGRVVRCDTAGRPVMSLERPVFLDASAALTPFLPISQGVVVVRDRGTSGGFGPGGFASGGRVGSVQQGCFIATTFYWAAVRVHIPNGPTVETPDVQVELPCPTESPVACDSLIETSDAGASAADDPPAPAPAFGCTASPSSGTLAWLVPLLAIALRRARRA